MQAAADDAGAKAPGDVQAPALDPKALPPDPALQAPDPIPAPPTHTLSPASNLAPFAPHAAAPDVYPAPAAPQANPQPPPPPRLRQAMAIRLSCRSYFLSSTSVDVCVPQQLEVKKSVAEAAVAFSSFAGKAVRDLAQL